MNTTAVKRIYYTPQIAMIELDNDISLSLESVVPEPDEPGVTLNRSQHINSNPFKTDFS